VTTAAYHGETVIILAPSGARAVVQLSDERRSYIILDGLILHGAKTAANVVKLTAGSRTGASNHIRIRNSEVRNAVQQGILVSQRGADYNEFINLRVHDNGSSHLDHGIYIENNYNLVQGCNVYKNRGSGIHIYKLKGANKLD